MTIRLRLDLEYDGTDFAGWQAQPGQRTVQGVLVRAFGAVLRAQVKIVAAGRTDAGVHARGQVAHADADVPRESVDLRRVWRSVNALVRPDVAVRDVGFAPEGFHARYSATGRTYCYRVAWRPHALDRKMIWVLGRQPDRGLMELALPGLIGKYPATSWCAAHAPDRHAVVEVRSAQFFDEGDALVLEITADRFVTHMARTIVGTLIEIGRQHRAPESIPGLIRARDRNLAGPTAPAHGLCLEHVEYDKWNHRTINGGADVSGSG